MGGTEVSKGKLKGGREEGESITGSVKEENELKGGREGHRRFNWKCRGRE